MIIAGNGRVLKAYVFILWPYVLKNIYNVNEIGKIPGIWPTTTPKYHNSEMAWLLFQKCKSSLSPSLSFKVSQKLQDPTDPYFILMCFVHRFVVVIDSFCTT